MIFWCLQVVDNVKAARAFYDSGSVSQHFFLRGGRIGTWLNAKKKLNRELRQIGERGGAGWLDCWLGGAAALTFIRVNPGCSGLIRPKKLFL